MCSILKYIGNPYITTVKLPTRIRSYDEILGLDQAEMVWTCVVETGWPGTGGRSKTNMYLVQEAWVVHNGSGLYNDSLYYSSDWAYL